MQNALSRQTGYAPVENGELYYEVTGAGPALLFIHAGVADHTMWEPQLAPFSQSRTVVTYDTRGFGLSRTKDTSFANRQDVRDLLKHLGIEAATLIGNSRGGQIAIDTALVYPDMVSGLVWICGGIGGTDFEPTQAEIDWFDGLMALEDAKDWAKLSDLEAYTWTDGIGQPADRAPADVRAKVRQMIYDSYVREDGEAEARPLEPLSATRLKELKVPVLVVIGDLDTTTTQASADLLAREAPNARRVVFHSVAHMVSMEKPEEFNKLLQDFLRSEGL